MSAPLNNKTLLDPEILDVLLSQKADIFQSLNCVKVGQIVSFDATKKTAQVQILFKRVIPDPSNQATGIRIQDYPVLLDCPVFTPQGGGGALQFPIAAGDQCILLFSDRNIDAWFQTGSAQAPFDARCHDLSDGICLVGINSLVSSLAANPATTVRLKYLDAHIDLTAASLVKIANNTTTLLTLITDFLTLLEAITVQDGATTLPLTAASIAAIEAYKLQFATLLL